MNTFLNQEEATFYHITTIENWEGIKINGFHSTEGKIFVSRVGELPILLAIALEQLPEIYDTETIVFLKFPQKLNNFTSKEIIQDKQAGVEWTQPFQNIILRKNIPIENIEIMNMIDIGNNDEIRTSRMTWLTQIANSGQNNYKNHCILQRAKEIKY
ncbi:hypothetical protein [Psychroserpens sp. NJDZ02]|uniref:hypothetical protein n=1 Tax=Psychroserpens sp. NJDZ02 TaxID=2570561 RepID=UPI0010A880EC|nr:hypothetical protein [Psychroserpens sp. NJDZ02]QCE39913.1 hypothetical protein E9099_00180 [Psychroserpens sp. NJDZ02]